MHLNTAGSFKRAAAQDMSIGRQDTGTIGLGLGSATVPSMASPSRCNTSDLDAVVFSIQFYGKTIGEVGLLDQDLSQLDWQRFKSYLFQNLLSMNNQENICVSYSDDEGDKLPIESEEEYREALKVAKKKAECHDKLVLDITRQGGLPTMLSFVSSGIKRASSSPPKEGGMSFFKASSLPKDSSGFMTRTSQAPERRIFPSFFSTDRGAEEASGGGTQHKESDKHGEQPPEWFTTYMNKFRDELCEEVISKLALMMKQEGLEAPKTEKKSDNKFSLKVKTPARLHTSLRTDSEVVKDTFDFDDLFPVRGSLRSDNAVAAGKDAIHCSSQKKSSNPSNIEKRGNDPIFIQGFKTISSDTENHSRKKVEDVKEELGQADSSVKLVNPQKRSSFQIGFPAQSNVMKDKVPGDDNHPSNHPRRKEREGKKVNGSHTQRDTKSTDGGVKRKKSVNDEKVTKWLEKMEERMSRKQGKMEERFLKKHEKLDERFVKKQEKLAERFQKQQEKVEKRRSVGRRPQVEVENMKAQSKVMAKYEALVKKQLCTVEEVSKLRKVLDKHHKNSDRHHDGKTADQGHLRRSERKSGCLKGGKSRKTDSDTKACPVDPSLLHKALLELELLAENSPGESHSSAATGYNAYYVKDITYPDGCKVLPGTQFVKTWRVLNSGYVAWNEKTELCKWTRVQFHGSGSRVDQKLKPLEKKVVCPPLKPGECGNISVTFIAPEEPGWYATHWRFCQQGHVFGNQIWCAVQVDYISANKVETASGDEAALPEDVQANVADDSERKECPEPVTSEELSEEETPVFMDAAKEVNKVENDDPAKASTGLICDVMCESHAEPPAPEDEEEEEEEEEQEPADYEVGIIENYYDAEDSAEEGVQPGVDDGRDSTSEAGATAKVNADLISFEEEAEVIPSGSASSDATSQLHFVVPLKDIAKESVDSLRDLMKESAAEKDKRESCDASSEIYGLDDLSLSSESFSDLDSDDQAILNESDSDVSDQDYFVVTMPKCFDLTHPYLGNASANASDAPEDSSCYPEHERHDSPDFLTADEDDRTTTAAQSHLKSCDETVAGNTSGMEDNEGDSHTGTVLEASQPSMESVNENPEAARDTTPTESNAVSMPLPPTETKGFMDIPPEALRTNLALSLYKEAVARPEADQQQQQQESSQINWGSGRDERQEVVCEQPVSAQVKGGGSVQNQNKTSPTASVMVEGSGQGTPMARNTHQPLSGDRAAALPDELVSIIPEDLVRGVWNTARTFISRINQEMLSPSGNGPRTVGDHEDNVRVASSTHTTQVPSQHNEPNQSSNTPRHEAVEEASLPPPLQQLADMGFSNHEMNQQLLTKYNNDVACAVAELIVLNCK